MVSRAAKTILGRVYGMAHSFRRRRLSGRFPILMYHSVNARHAYSVDPRMFDRQLNYLARNFSVYTIGELATLEAQRVEAAAVVTFDDGYLDNYEIALPILKNYGIRATFFICPAYASGTVDITRSFRNYRELRPMAWQHIGKLLACGMEIGAHSLTHRKLSGLDRQAKIDEICTCKHVLRTRLGTDIQSFAYPFGYPWTFDSECEELVRSEYEFCCTTRWGLNDPFSPSSAHRFRLRRIRVDAEDTLGDFASKLNGGWDYMRYVQAIRNVWVRAVSTQ